MNDIEGLKIRLGQILRPFCMKRLSPSETMLGRSIRKGKARASSLRGGRINSKIMFCEKAFVESSKPGYTIASWMILPPTE